MSTSSEAKTKVKNPCCWKLIHTVRLISILGLMVAVTLLATFLRDKISNNYENSRKTALVLGLDWRHFHHSANATREADPQGKVISIIMSVYTTLFFFTNTILLFGSITQSRWCAFLWMLFEIIGCISKLGALIYHSIADNGVLTKPFLTGSVIYIVVISWCILIVYSAQMEWKYRKFTLKKSCFSTEENRVKSENLEITFLSAPTYIPNKEYDSI